MDIKWEEIEGKVLNPKEEEKLPRGSNGEVSEREGISSVQTVLLGKRGRREGMEKTFCGKGELPKLSVWTTLLDDDTKVVGPFEREVFFFETSGKRGTSVS